MLIAVTVNCGLPLEYLTRIVTIFQAFENRRIFQNKRNREQAEAAALFLRHRGLQSARRVLLGNAKFSDGFAAPSQVDRVITVAGARVSCGVDER